MRSLEYEGDIPSMDRGLLADVKTPVSIIFVAMLIISAVAFDAIGGYSNITIGLGVLCGIVFVFYSIRQGIMMPGEAWFLSGFVGWSAGSLFNAMYFPLAARVLVTMVQLLVMVVIISNYCRNMRSAQILLFSLIVGISIVSFFSVITGEYQASEFASNDEGRVSGLTGNANLFGMYMFYITAALLFFFKGYKSLILKTCCILSLLVIAKFVVATGSREAFLCFAAMIIIWFFYTYRTEIFHRPLLFFGALVLFACFAVFISLELRDSAFVERFSKIAEIFQGGGGLSNNSDTRVSLIYQGISIIKSHPLIGVGFSNTMFHNSFQLYCHNNFVEVTACTGILGGILYYAVFITLWRRLRRLSLFREFMDSREIAMLNCAKSILLVRLISDMARVSYYNKVNWIFFAIMIGWSYHLMTKYKNYDYFQNFDDEILQSYEASPELISTN